MKTLFVVIVAVLGSVMVPAVAAAADAPKADAAVADVSGTWDAVVETAQGSGTPVFTLKQEGEKLTGRYQGQFGEAPLTGTIKRSSISFSFTTPAGENLKIEYTGTVEGATMKGTAKFGDYGDGTFTAKKRAR